MKLCFRRPRRAAKMQTECSISPTGYDAPETDLDRDRLGRRQVAAAVYNLLVATPEDWSTRVGLFGAWGEGKTTVCGFVEQLARKDGHLVIWFNPWSSRSIEELSVRFAQCLYDGLKASGVNLEGTILWRLMNIGREVAGPVQQAVEVHPYSKAIYSVGVPLFNKLREDETVLRPSRNGAGDGLAEFSA
jgi:hypothetical protein